ncbi:MAG: GH32 C-terminal domain-containing protein [Paramuribaculum sp.]|nr:GH32 C-terminal domain-containing protein [Paramuribaculum sp.]
MNIKLGLMALSIFGASALAPVPASGADGIEINHLGINNTLVRVGDGGRYLMLPVQESNDDARINILVDGKIAETIYVRLAKSKTDYYVPFDLTPYKGKNIVLDVVTPQGRSSIREAKEDVCWRGFELTDTPDMTDRETKFRPAFHHTPMYGWMNDPNGMFYKDGVWHLYYQFNPYGSKWQNMTWGHSTSTDLVNWKHEPVAIRPDGLGSIFSGSSVVDHNNTAGFGKDAIIALYTSAGTSQMQSLASSTDNGQTFTPYPSNPIITLETEARDPNMFWNEKTGEWNLVLAHALEREMLFFTSPDLKTWTLQSSFGKGEGEQSGVWECPDLFPLKVDGTGETKWVLICNINPGGPFGGSAVQYFIGDWDGKTFTADKDATGKIPTKWLDYGKDNYALVSWSDAPEGRRTAIGWMSNWQYAAEVPTMQYRSANTLPREIGLFRAADGEIYVSNAPSPEVLALRNRLVADKSNISLGNIAKSFTLPEANGGLYEIIAEIDAAGCDSLKMVLSNKADNKVILTYNAAERKMYFDRTKSGIVDFSESFPVVTASPTFEDNGKITVRMFIDRSSIEMFGNDGRFVMTNLVFPEMPYSSLALSSFGGKAKVKNLKIYSLSTK